MTIDIPKIEMDELPYLGWCEGRIEPILVHSCSARRKDEKCCGDPQKAPCNGEQYAFSGGHGGMFLMPNACVCDGGDQVSPGTRGSTAVRRTQWLGHGDSEVTYLYTSRNVQTIRSGTA